MLNQFFHINTSTFGTYAGRLRVIWLFFSYHSNLQGHDNKLLLLKTKYKSKIKEGKQIIFLKYDSSSFWLWIWSDFSSWSLTLHDLFMVGTTELLLNGEKCFVGGSIFPEREKLANIKSGKWRKRHHTFGAL